MICGIVLDFSLNHIMGVPENRERDVHINTGVRRMGLCDAVALRMALPVWRELLPKATWQHHIIEKGYVLVALGYPGQTKAPRALTTNPERDIM